MSPEQAAALRKPFDAKVVGKLPKPMYRDAKKGNCGECGGYHGLPAVHLDYVGHAATTDRLLAVDPGWSWEPMAIDEHGLPALDRKGNLWIRLTIGGVTRIGVGDGNSAKECIGDAIRNAAMRFGVALDLWSKEELEQADGPAAPVQTSGVGGSPAQAQQPPAVAASSPPAPEGVLIDVKSRLAKSMYAGINDAIKAGQIGKDDRIPFVCMAIGRAVESTKELTEDETRRVLNELDRIKSATGDPA